MNDTIENLTKEYQQWAAAKDLPKMSADELLVQTDQDGRYIVRSLLERTYLENFIARWEAAQEASAK